MLVVETERFSLECSLSQLVKDFRAHFRADPEWLVTAPGRVNLIGDHTDYNGLPVFPMAIQRSVRIVGRTRSDSLVRLINEDPSYAVCGFNLGLPLSPGHNRWVNYVMAGVGGVAANREAIRGFDGLLSSNVPVAAGLSSSSALVVAAGLATLGGDDAAFDPLEFASRMARAEQFVGTMGGGMDQAVCLGGRVGHATLIEFEPLAVELVPVPQSWRFVVANSLQLAEKSGGAQKEYNLRTSQCHEALEQVRIAMGLDGTVGYRDLLDRYTPEELMAVADRALPRELGDRFRHTLSEGGRVLEAARAMASRNPQHFGALMLQSHASLRDHYGVSTERLDQLVETFMQAGALGARLTGAGFGGCVVALCEADTSTRVRQQLHHFFNKHGLPSRHVLFEAIPSDGARIVRW